MLTTVFAALIVFQLKHFLCDYPLQTPYMLGKFKETGWMKPLAAHAGVHACFTWAICLIYFSHLDPDRLAWAPLLGLFDFCVHFVVDRVKASKNLLGRWNTNEPEFWWALGGDQAMHHLTHYAIIYVLVAP